MLSREIEFKQNDETVEMWVERDYPPFDDYVIGIFKKDHQGYFRLHPSAGAEMHCKHLREAAQKANELNAAIPIN